MSEIVDIVPESSEKGTDLVELGFDLNAKMLDCAEKYLKHFDLLRAVREVWGHKGQVAYNKTSYLRRHAGFVAYLEARIRERALPADAVLAQLAMIATASFEDFLDEDYLESTGNARLDLRKAKIIGSTGAIKKIEFLASGGYRIELYDKLRALEDLGKHLGLLKDPETKVDNYIITVVREE